MSVTPIARRSGGAGSRARSGSPLLTPVLAFVVLTIAYVIANRSTPQPTASGPEVLKYTQDHGTAIMLGSVLLFASAVSLALAAAMLFRRLRALRSSTAGPAITLVGGVLAAGALTVSAIFAWSGGQLAADADPALARSLADVSFLSGGLAYALSFALLIAGISVPAPRAGLLPRAVTWTGLVLVAAGLLSTLGLLVPAFNFALPVVRFGGLVWLVFAAAMLPRTGPSSHS